MDVKQLTSSIEKNEFYPTPKELVDKMLCDINWTYVSSILEPSAGKGDIVKSIRETRGKYYEYLDVDCIEIDTNLQHILRGEGFRVVHDNFLTFNTLKQYSLIIMNPPFSNGDKHLMKALKMQENGGNIICLLNAETLKNPYSIERQSLIKTLNKYNANIEYIQNAFVSAERKTNVEVALIKVSIPKVVQESEIYERMKKAIHFEEVEHMEKTEIV